MGLFDKIKKSLFGNSDEDQEEKEKSKKKNEELAEEKSENDQNAQEDKNEEAPVTNEDEEVNKEKNEAEDDTILESNAENNEEESDLAENSEDSDITEDEDAEAAEEDKHEEADQKKLYEKGLEKTNKGFGAKLNAFFAKFRTVDEDFFDDLEDLLIESDVGYQTAEELTEQLRDEAKLQKAKTRDELKQVIVEKLVALYDQNGNADDEKLIYHDDQKPNVYLFVGVFGAGKSRTIGILAKLYKDQGKSVLMAAADTFRAGAVEQLVEWGKRVDVPVVTGKEKADPASVVYDATKKALDEGYDYLLVDTAGRLQNKKNLMNELEKIQRTIKKLAPEEPTETLLVLDGSTGQNALLQAKDFDKTTKLTGLVLTKLDGSSKGGVVLAIRNEMKLPVKLVGLGEKAEDLADFDAANYAIGLFHGLV
mgnify:CR=1 FL=1